MFSRFVTLSLHRTRAISKVSFGQTLSATLSSPSDSFCLEENKVKVKGQNTKEQKKMRKAWGDSFGSLSTDPVFAHEQERDSTDLLDHDEEEEYLSKVDDDTRPDRAHFGRKIKRLLTEENDLQGALRVLEVEMKQEERSPLEGHYRMLIHACGKAGYHKKAFILFKEYQGRQLRPNQGVYADLFNSCANSPYADDALDEARYLRRKLVHLGTPLSQVVYHNMLKAFGRCGDLNTAFLIVDEMKEKEVVIDGNTFCHLLQGCISDKETGFRHAIMVWRLMLNRRYVVINEAHFAQLLWAARDCGAGDVDFYRDILLACMSVSEARKHGQMLLEAMEPRPLQIEGDNQNQAEKEAFVRKQKLTDMLPAGMVELVPEEEKSERLQLQTLAGHGTKLPSVLDKKPNFSGVISIGNLATAQQRLSLLGGPSGVCEAIKRRHLAPSVKMFGFMMDMVGDNEESEAALLALMEREKIKPDTIMLNMLIKRRAHRYDHKLGLSTIALFSQYNLTPDVVTFGVLAMCCRTKADSKQLLLDMKHQGFQPNLEIFSALVGNACTCLNPIMLIFLLRQMDKYQIAPNKGILARVEKFNERYRGYVLELERGKHATTPIDSTKALVTKEGSQRSKNIPKIVLRDMEADFLAYREFRDFYSDWIRRTEVDLEAEAHPWRQYINEKDLGRAEKGNKEFSSIIESGATVIPK